MKTMKLLTLAALLCASATVSAQNTVVTLDQQMKNKQTTKTTKAAPAARTASVSSLAGWQSFYVQYNASEFHWSSDGHSENTSMSGVSLGWNQAMPIAGDTPLFFQYGAALRYGWHSEEMLREDMKQSMLDVKIPLNLVYSIPVSGSVSIDPFAGLYARGIILAKAKWGDDSFSYFSEDDMGDDTWNRFTMGAQLGLNVRFSDYYAGVSYGMDFLKVTDDTTIRGFDITLGVTF